MHGADARCEIWIVGDASLKSCVEVADAAPTDASDAGALDRRWWIALTRRAADELDDLKLTVPPLATMRTEPAPSSSQLKNEPSSSESAASSSHGPVSAALP